MAPDLRRTCNRAGRQILLWQYLENFALTYRYHIQIPIRSHRHVRYTAKLLSKDHIVGLKGHGPLDGSSTQKFGECKVSPIVIQFKVVYSTVMYIRYKKI